MSPVRERRERERERCIPDLAEDVWFVHAAATSNRFKPSCQLIVLLGPCLFRLLPSLSVLRDRLPVQQPSQIGKHMYSPFAFTDLHFVDFLYLYTTPVQVQLVLT